MSDMDEIVKEFLIESFENLERLSEDFLVLEKTPDDRVVLSRLFRTIHTIKGTCGFLGYGRLESLTHVGESLLARIRDGVLRLDAPMTDALLAMADSVRVILQEVERSGTDGVEDYADLKARLAALAKGEAPPVVEAPPVAAASPLAETPGAVSVAAASTAPFASDEGSAPKGDRASSAIADGGVRVDVALLDRLMTLTGELVLARNQLLQVLQPGADARSLAVAQRLSYVTSELQESVTKTRMQPIGGAWTRLPRLVRDLSATLKKKITLVSEGHDVELDRSVIDAIKDPLTHIIRNACDHGIETPEERVRRGKSPEGRIHMRAYHRAGLVNLDVEDDGGGIPVERVRRKAVERGLLTEEEAAALDDDSARRLIFKAGFSTAETVTNVSGRGVGMDVVKSSVEKIGGFVELASEEGVGSRITVRIPLTLAIVPALTVRVGGERFAVPHGNVRELVKIEPDAEDGAARLEMIGDTPVLRLRDRLLAVARLRDLVGSSPDDAAPTEEHVVVLQSEDRRFGLVVDDVCDTREIVVKPLLAALRSIGLFAGATIMGDGGVVLVLDVAGIARAARVEGDGVALEQEAAASAAASAAAKPPLGKQWLLATGAGRRIAIALERIQRLEQIDHASVEDAGGDLVVQYRGGLLRLVAPATDTRVKSAAEARPLQVVVVDTDGSSVGVVVDEVEDVADSDAPVRATNTPGVEGVVVVRGRVVEIPNIATLAPATARR